MKRILGSFLSTTLALILYFSPSSAHSAPLCGNATWEHWDGEECDHALQGMDYICTKSCKYKFDPNEAKQTCDDGFTVVRPDYLGFCKGLNCSFGDALQEAAKCDKPTKIRFLADVFHPKDANTKPAEIDLDNFKKVNSDLINQQFKFPKGYSEKGIEIDGGEGGVVFKGNNANSFMFYVDTQNVTFKNIIFKGIGGVELGPNAKSVDVKNIRTDKPGFPILKSAAADSSDVNVPVMVVPGSNSGEHIVLAILPNDSEPDASKLRFCETTNAASNDCFSTGIKLVSFKTRKLMDTAGKPTDSTKIILEMTLSGADANKNYMAFVKNTGKSVAIANLKTGLAPLYKDSDGDFLRDIDESTYFKTDPSLKDTDKDGIDDLYNVIGIPGEPYAQTSGADIFPAADANGFLPGAFKQQPTPNSQNTDTPTEEKSGCSMMVGGSASPLSSMFSFVSSLVGLGLIGTIRRRLK